jgi:alkanesulfonate monooxygenase SsuD/methylene tetrahydromethanopterin reductase-like flavin-dependent oxidoreductase (luciferase family)
MGLAPFGVREGEELTRRPAEELQSAMRAIEHAGLDHVVMGDHISFHGGHGSDGLIEAALMLGAHPRLRVHLAVYLLPLRHPVLVARQLASIAQVAPGRLHLGIGVGGEDRHEVEITGVDPATRGRRCDESLMVLRRLLSGDPVTHHGEFFDFDAAVILPSPDPPIPMVVGGRSDAALRRAGLYADGWLAIWVSPARFTESIEKLEARAAEAGREAVAWDHGLLVWCGLGDSIEDARERLAAVLERVYRTPFSKFERYAPVGQPEDVAASLMPYVEAGARHFDLVTVASSPNHAIEGIGEVRRLLAAG